MGRLRALASDVRGGLIELARPGESTLSGLALWRLGAVALSFVLFVANLIGAIAGRVAVALDNAMLFETERRTALAFQQSLLPQSVLRTSWWRRWSGCGSGPSSCSPGFAGG